MKCSKGCLPCSDNIVGLPAGDGVELRSEDGIPFARGISSVDSAELAGRPAKVEAVHRDRLVLL